jgi:outer membrane lipoprotein-sorting protein
VASFDAVGMLLVLLLLAAAALFALWSHGVQFLVSALRRTLAEHAEALDDLTAKYEELRVSRVSTHETPLSASDLSEARETAVVAA